MDGSAVAATFSDGTLLGGRIAYRQFRAGYRTGIEPVLLAASVPAAPGEQVLEAGCGAGAGLLCLSSRGAFTGTGIEQDAATAALARHNLDSNGLTDWPILALPLQAAAMQLADHPAHGRFDHAMANPPWHRATASASPSARRDMARRAMPGGLGHWVAALAGLLRPGGTLTLVLPAALHAEAASAMLGCGVGGITLFPFWPRQGRAARIVLVQGLAGSRGDASVRPGLVLHQPGGGFTEEAEAILRGGAPLSMR